MVKTQEAGATHGGIDEGRNKRPKEAMGTGITQTRFQAQDSWF